MEVERIDMGNGYTCIIECDENPSNPRDDDNLGKLLCFHKRYTLGDSHSLDADDFNGRAELEEHLINEEDAIIILPVYMYDHSGLVLSTEPFGCRWDSGQLGFMYLPKAKLIEEYGEDTPEARETAERCLKAELKAYGHYVAGEVFGYILLGPGDHDVCSCWGFFGYDHEESGLLELARDAMNYDLAAENVNYLIGMACPDCKSKGPFLIVCLVPMLVHDDGAEPAQGSVTVWDETSNCRCHSCEKSGSVADFKQRAENPDDHR